MLYICPTPIGNLEDITIRSLKTLKNVDQIYCEDTRNTIKLLNHYNIKKPLFSLFEHNESKKSQEIMDKLHEGMDIAYVSDAGMPGISDPGQILISMMVENNLDFTVLPGSSAFVVALVASGLSTSRFTFLGFLDRNKSKMKKDLESVKDREESLIIYESPHRIIKTVASIYQVLGNRKITLAREISKKFEEYIRSDCQKLLEDLQKDRVTIRGEMIIIIDGKKSIKENLSPDKIKEEIKKYMVDGFSKKDSVKKVTEKFDLKKNQVYKLSQEI